MDNTIKNINDLFNELKTRIENNNYQIEDFQTSGSDYDEIGYTYFKLPTLIIILNPGIKIGNDIIQRVGYAYNFDAGDNSSYITFNTNTADLTDKDVYTDNAYPDLLKVFNEKFKNIYKTKYYEQKDIEKRKQNDEFGSSNISLSDVGMSTNDLQEIINYFRNK